MCSPGLSELESLRWPPMPTWAPSWAAKAHLGAKLDCQGAFGRQLGASWTPIGRQLGAKLDCHNGCQRQRTS